jgi:CIC family chloride channel protein
MIRQQVMQLIHGPLLMIKSRLSDKNFLIASSILVGLTSGLLAVALKYAVHLMGRVASYAQGSDKFVLIALLPLAGIMLAIFFTRYYLKGDLKKGSAMIVYAILKKSSLIRFTECYGHLVTSALTVGLGGSLGLESPMVSTGAAIGSNYGRTYQLSYKERTVLLGCGAAAGIAAAFNSPVAGVLFVIEVLLTDISASSFIPLIISAACGALVSKIILAEGVTLAFTLQQPFNYHFVPYYVVLGFVCGLASIMYRRIFHGIEMRFENVKRQWAKGIYGGLILFALILFFPPLFGEGYAGVKLLEFNNTQQLIHGSLVADFIQSEPLILTFISLLVIFKAVAAAVTFSSGGNGGSFAPSLVIGSYLGFLFSRFVNFTKLTVLPISNFTIVAMAGILSGIFYAPLTAIFLIAEITGGYGLIIPLMIVSSLSLVTVHLFDPLSMEARKLSKLLKLTVETKDKLLLSRIDLHELIETTFATIDVNASFSDLIKKVAVSSRNTFPVIDANQKLLGLIHLDKIRTIMFDQSRYDTTTLRDLMVKPSATVELTENIYEALAKFESTGQWNLPIVDNGRYKGFLSKSTILSRYRKELMNVS